MTRDVIEKRIFGIETEFGTTIEIEPLMGEHRNKFLLSFLPARMELSPWGDVNSRAPRLMLPNQGCLYIDAGAGEHLEYATPECEGAQEAVRYETVGLALVARGIRKFSRAYPDLPRPFFSKTNRNARYSESGLSQACQGSHANLLTLRRLDLKTIQQCLAPFLLSRPCITGNGWIKFHTDGSLQFLLSQRLDVTKKLWDEPLRGDKKPLFNSRDTVYADPEKWSRFHDVSGDANMSEWQLFLKYASLDMVFAMIEDGFLISRCPPSLVTKAGAVKHIASVLNREPFVWPRAQWGDGREWNALNWQYFYCESAQEFFRSGRAPLTEERKRALDMWTKILDALSRADVLFLRRYLDWAALWSYAIEPKLERAGLDPHALVVLPENQTKRVRFDTLIPARPGKIKLIDFLLSLFVSYANVEISDGIYGLLLRQGMMEHMFSDFFIEEALFQTPQHTRARWRALGLRLIAQLGRRHKKVRFRSLDWQSIIFYDGCERVTLENDNPYRWSLNKDDKEIFRSRGLGTPSKK